MVYYRKYRPQTVAELDLEEVRGKLESILSAKELPHAFLFTGPKGLGKTSAARIIAKAINCERNSKFKIQNCKSKIKSRKTREKFSNQTMKQLNHVMFAITVFRLRMAQILTFWRLTPLQIVGLMKSEIFEKK